MENVFNKYDFLEKENIYFYIKNINIEQLPLRMNRSLHEMEISPYAILISVGKPLILFFENHKNKELIFKQCWNFSEAPIVFIETENDFELYNAYEFIIDNGEFLLEELDKKKFNYLSIISGDYFNQDIFKKTENKIDKKLLENIKNARFKLLGQGINKELANALLGRIIFIRYLIDRKVKLSHNGEKQLLNNDKFVSILNNKKETYELFRYLKSHDGFNGDWFPILENEENLINEIQLKVLSELVAGTEIKTGQRSLFDIYDFSIIPIEFISNVYESFIGEEAQSLNGAFYTPTFLVDYILKYTIDDYFTKNPNSYSCKVIDPACGSGIFLVETLIWLH
ncbi:N-6 DNA methylase [Aliarcobacter skirrowii]|uniref:N-6 DNA methylase n=1 Tax=Aliarcobacter skirrowii TaxID=28200 RepID=UPI002A36DE0D|nr:N-6 DNA methylase [Aliarcobacter skirrowii]MDY0181332.1 N-6 DNA methylase [Aliarcobacter skirrowii]